MSKILPVLVAAVSLAASGALSTSYALSTKECSKLYKEAKDAGTLNGMKWNDFRKAKCAAKSSDTSASDSSTTKKTSTKKATSSSSSSSTSSSSSSSSSSGSTKKSTTKTAAAAGTAPAGVKFPSKVNSKYANESAGVARRKTCLDQYNANKEAGTLKGMKWTETGGGYYSVCNARLKQ